MKIQILSLAMICLMTACSKESSNKLVELPNLKQKSVSIKNINIELPFNARNPIDSIGIIHNQALKFVYRKLTETNDFSDNLKRKYVSEFFENRYGENPLNAMLQRRRQRQLKKLNVTELTEKFHCSKTLTKNIFEVFTFAKEMKSPFDYGTFKKKITDLEDNALSGKLKLDSNELKQLLHLTSVYRHSMYFWMQAISENPGKSETEFLRKFIRAILGAGADAYGAVESFFTYLSFRWALEDASLDSAMMLWAFDN